MRRAILLLLIAILATSIIRAQNQLTSEGTVTHITSSSVYVRFSSTATISKGDTLFVRQGNLNVPALIVEGVSSLSAVCKPLSDEIKLNLNDKILQGIVHVKEQVQPVKDTTKLSQPIAQASPARVENIKGRVSVASYNNFSNTPAGNTQRMRYTFMLNARNISDSRVSAETYVSFVHRSGQWSEIKDNIFHGLKIYNLNFSYEAGNNLKLTAGRKINPRLSNMGAVDGLQAEYKINSFRTGAIIGSRPNNLDYSFNTSLFQYGVYLSHERSTDNGNIETTLAFADQRNKGAVDRRFAYLQHSNSVIKNLFLFGSAEFDIYRLVNTVQENSPRLSNLYVSARYRALKNLSLSLSYSARKNIIYYETYKTTLETLIENELQQGFMAQVNYRPLNKLSVGGTAGYRKRKNDPADSKNAYIYASYSEIPLIKAAFTVSGNLIETSYLSGKIYSAGLSRNIFKQKVSSSLTYRYQDYTFSNSESQLVQHTIEAGFNWFILKKLSMAVNYEGTFEDINTYNRVYLQLTKRF
ncbi:MAG TPA: hypothetical protein VK212_07625 [Lentimicrobium sp.]|nr:hypothetical protein [Lentimicrobium sp.]